MATMAKLGTVVLALVAATAGATEDAGLGAIERAFWRCDHASTQGALNGGEAMDCSLAYEALKARRFGGDFKALLAWWQANKDAQHLALSAAPPQRVTRAAPRP